ncbi:chromosomal replication initiator protein DnaA [Mycoplasma sp. 1654_15]|uniref:chromosomal replication initiator protein DnaA n=1 Tax=Mycoplasma sp. 1654_15 TaxID=2725994 RepID=UPI001449005A|nr:chromosomal replication initiator protein DnaA [Mycoplasma sp. 1654_15]QJB70916.1 chromosomal replication initiator protein DnaA [Mycoplasma sp. 1654_15]
MKNNDNQIFLETINSKNTTLLLINYFETSVDDQIIFNSFFRQIKVLAENNVEIILKVENNFIKKEIEEKWMHLIERAVFEVTGIKKIISLTISDNLELPKPSENAKVSKIEDYSLEIAQKSSENKEKIKFNNILTNKYNFGNFVLTNFNKNIIKAYENIINAESIIYSPLFLYGSSGIGKTHFLHAIGSEFIKRKKTVYYIHSSAFTTLITNWMIKKENIDINHFVETVCLADVLLFDEIQLLANKTSTMSVLLQIVNNFIENDKQIIITSDKSPDVLGGFEERFITRFNSGLILEFSKPTKEDFLKLLKYKLEIQGINPESFQKDALEFLVYNKKSVREIEGVVNRIKFFSEGENITDFNLELIERIFKGIIKNKENLTHNKIIEEVANYYNIDKEDITGTTRKKEVVIARDISIWFVKNLLDLTLKSIGQIFGDKDHSTIIAVVNKINVKKEKDPTVKYAIEKINEKISKFL